MPVVIPPGFVNVTFIHTGPSVTRPNINVMGFNPPSPITESDVEDMIGPWEDQVVFGQSNQWALTEVQVRDATGLIFDVPRSAVGGDSSTPATPQVSCLVKKLTGLGGRKNRGRAYIGGMCENKVDPVGALDVTYRTTVQGRWNTMLSDWLGLGWEPVILHSGSSDPTPIASFLVEGLSATQRRRLRK
jgi:hypothetical protein